MAEQKTTSGQWGSGNILCNSCGRELQTEWVQKPGQPQPTARHKRCTCPVQSVWKQFDALRNLAQRAGKKSAE